MAVRGVRYGDQCYLEPNQGWSLAPPGGGEEGQPSDTRLVGTMLTHEYSMVLAVVCAV